MMKTTPAERLRETLTLERERGASFDDAWGPAVRGASRNSPAWREALEETEDTWRSSYENLPAPRRERAVAELRELAAEGDDWSREARTRVLN